MFVFIFLFPTFLWIHNINLLNFYFNDLNLPLSSKINGLSTLSGQFNKKKIAYINMSAAVKNIACINYHVDLKSRTYYSNNYFLKLHQKNCIAECE